MPTFLVTFPDSPAVPVIGTDEVDAVAGALQSLDSLRDVIALCADTVPEMAAVCERAAPRASAAQPWPEAAAIRAVVAWWMGRHPEIVVQARCEYAFAGQRHAPGCRVEALLSANTTEDVLRAALPAASDEERFAINARIGYVRMLVQS